MGNTGQADAVDDLADLGRQWVEPDGGVPGHFGPFLVDESIVGTIVAAIAKSTDREFLDAATKVLAKRTPDSLVRNHASVLESVLAHRQDLQWKGLLIGKLGSQRGLRIIQDSKSYLEGNPREAMAVLGKLGRKDAEEKVIDAYLQEKDGTQKEALAELMGHSVPSASNRRQGVTEKEEHSFEVGAAHPREARLVVQRPREKSGPEASCRVYPKGAVARARDGLPYSTHPKEGLIRDFLGFPFYTE